MDFKIFLRDFIIDPLVSKDFSAFLIIIDLLSGIDTAMEIDKKVILSAAEHQRYTLCIWKDLCRLQQINVTFTSI